MKVFLSYARDDADLAKAVAEDIKKFDGNTVWYDHDLAGGQVWWATILRQIRDCDAVVVVLTAKYIASQSCKKEFEYAAQLQKNILPALCDEERKVHPLPAELSKIHYVDCRAQDKNAAFAMVHAFRQLPEVKPLPNPLPREPRLPKAHLGELRDQIESDQELSRAEQSDLVIRLKQQLKGADREHALNLLRKFRERPDLRKIVSDDIDEALSKYDRRFWPFFRRGRARARVDAAEPDAAGIEHATAVSLESAFDGDEARGIEAIIARVAQSAERWVCEFGADELSIAVEPGELILTAAFSRWSYFEERRLQEMGWSVETATTWVMRGLGGFGLGVGLATNRFGLRLEGKRRRRDYLSRHVMTKRLPLSQLQAAARDVKQALHALAPDGVTVIVSKFRARRT